MKKNNKIHIITNIIIIIIIFIIKDNVIQSTPVPSSMNSIYDYKITKREINNLKYIQKINQEALNHYLNGKTVEALTIYHEYLLISSLSVPIEIFQNMGWMLRSYEKFSLKGYGIKTAKLEEIIHIMTSFQSLLNMHNIIIPKNSKFATNTIMSSTKDALLSTWKEEIIYGEGGIAIKFFINFEMKRYTKENLKDHMGDFVRVKIVSLGKSQYLPYLLPPANFHFKTIYDYVFNGMMFKFPYMYSVNEESNYRNTTINTANISSSPLLAVDNRDLKYLDLMKKTLTGYLNSQYSDNEDIQTHLWDMTFSNIRSLTNHTKTPSNVLTSTHVATLNFMQLVVADVVIRNQIDGDIIEAGVFRGGMSMFLVSCLNIFEGVLERMNFMKKNNNNYMEGDKLDIIKKKKFF